MESVLSPGGSSHQFLSRIRMLNLISSVTEISSTVLQFHDNEANSNLVSQMLPSLQSHKTKQVRESTFLPMKTHPPTAGGTGSLFSDLFDHVS